MLSAFGKKYHDNGGAGRENACCLCGKAVKGPDRFMAECVGGGGTFVRSTDDPAEVEAARADQASYMGWYLVGPDCAKRLKKDDVIIEARADA